MKAVLLSTMALFGFMVAPSRSHAQVAKASAPDIEIWSEMLFRSYNNQLPASSKDAPQFISMKGNERTIAELLQLRARTLAEGVEYGQAVHGFISGEEVRFRFTPKYSGNKSSVVADLFGEDYYEEIKSHYPKARGALNIHTHPTADTFSPQDVLLALQRRRLSIVVTTSDIFLAVPSSTRQLGYLEAALIMSGDHPHEDKFVCDTMGVFGEDRIKASNISRHGIYSQIGITIYKYDDLSQSFVKIPSSSEQSLYPFIDRFKTQTRDAVRMVIAEEGVDAVRRDVSTAEFAAKVKARVGLPFAQYALLAVKLRDMGTKFGGETLKHYKSPTDPSSDWVLVHSVGHTSCEASAASIRFGTGDEKPSVIYEIRVNSGKVVLNKVK